MPPSAMSWNLCKIVLKIIARLIAELLGIMSNDEQEEA